MNCATENPRFSIQSGYVCRESIAIVSAADWLGAIVKWERSPSPGTIPIGPVEFCEPAFGPHRKEFYPDFLRGFFHRWIEFTGGPWLFDKPSFVKDARAWKSDYISAVHLPGFALPVGEWWISESVEFVQEWRYYVANGSVVTTGWYAGDDEGEPAPDVAVAWPDGFSGAVDFGRLADGRIALVEAHAPFACGWYGDDHRDYALWQAMAWESAEWWR